MRVEAAEEVLNVVVLSGIRFELRRGDWSNCCSE